MTSSLQQQASQVTHDMAELSSMSYISFLAFIFAKIKGSIFKGLAPMLNAPISMNSF